MDYGPHVGLVDSHPESLGSHDNRRLSILEPLLHLAAVEVGKPGVVGLGPETEPPQRPSESLRHLAGRHVDDRAPAPFVLAVKVLEVAEQLRQLG